MFAYFVLHKRIYWHSGQATLNGVVFRTFNASKRWAFAWNHNWINKVRIYTQSAELRLTAHYSPCSHTTCFPSLTLSWLLCTNAPILKWQNIRPFLDVNGGCAILPVLCHITFYCMRWADGCGNECKRSDALASSIFHFKLLPLCLAKGERSNRIYFHALLYDESASDNHLLDYMSVFEKDVRVGGREKQTRHSCRAGALFRLQSTHSSRMSWNVNSVFCWMLWLEMWCRESDFDHNVISRMKGSLTTKWKETYYGFYEQEKNVRIRAGDRKLIKLTSTPFFHRIIDWLIDWCLIDNKWEQINVRREHDKSSKLILIRQPNLIFLTTSAFKLKPFIFSRSNVQIRLVPKRSTI